MAGTPIVVSGSGVYRPSEPAGPEETTAPVDPTLTTSAPTTAAPVATASDAAGTKKQTRRGGAKRRVKAKKSRQELAKVQTDIDEINATIAQRVTENKTPDPELLARLAALQARKEEITGNIEKTVAEYAASKERQRRPTPASAPLPAASSTPASPASPASTDYIPIYTGSPLRPSPAALPTAAPQTSGSPQAPASAPVPKTPAWAQLPPKKSSALKIVAPGSASPANKTPTINNLDGCVDFEEASAEAMDHDKTASPASASATTTPMATKEPMSEVSSMPPTDACLFGDEDTMVRVRLPGAPVSKAAVEPVSKVVPGVLWSKVAAVAPNLKVAAVARVPTVVVPAPLGVSEHSRQKSAAASETDLANTYHFASSAEYVIDCDPPSPVIAPDATPDFCCWDRATSTSTMPQVVFTPPAGKSPAPAAKAPAQAAKASTPANKSPTPADKSPAPADKSPAGPVWRILRRPQDASLSAATNVVANAAAVPMSESPVSSKTLTPSQPAEAASGIVPAPSQPTPRMPSASSGTTGRTRSATQATDRSQVPRSSTRPPARGALRNAQASSSSRPTPAQPPVRTQSRTSSRSSSRSSTRSSDQPPARKITLLRRTAPGTSTAGSRPGPTSTSPVEPENSSPAFGSRSSSRQSSLEAAGVRRAQPSPPASRSTPEASGTSAQPSNPYAN